MTDGNEMGGVELNATQLDAQRARHLLDRALGLSERGDLAGAIVVCRQSLALAPQSPQGWSMLGLLHERDNDIHGAIAAYEKVLELSPGSTLERESLQRLRQQAGAAQRSSPKFNFDGATNSKPLLPSADGINDLPPDPTVSKSSNPLWNTFYFRSLPLLVAAISCLIFLIVTQRIAQNRQAAAPIAGAPVTAISAPQNVGETPNGNAVSAPANPNAVPPSTLAPRVIPAAPATNTQLPPALEPPQHSAVHSTPQKATPRAQPKTRTIPRPSAPAAMPVLPAPRITLPADNGAVPATNNSGAADENTDSSGGPIDVGNSPSDQYIPINPPHFPNPVRHPRSSRVPKNENTPLAQSTDVPAPRITQS